jgi:hypothetical protein
MEETGKKTESNSPENGSKKGEKTPDQGRFKGQFKKGNPGGPGRGKKKKAEAADDLHAVYTEAIRILRQALKSDNEAVRVRAANILASVFSNYRTPGDTIISPTLVEMLSGGRNDFEDTGGDVIDGKNFY